MLENKVKLIDEICKRHPSLGVEKGWSTYTGGMADTGHWFFRKMLDVPEQELKSFFDKVVEQDNEKKAKMIAEQCKPCSKDFYEGIRQGVLLALKASLTDKCLSASGWIEFEKQKPSNDKLVLVTNGGYVEICYYEKNDFHKAWRFDDSDKCVFKVYKKGHPRWTELYWQYIELPPIIQQ